MKDISAKTFLSACWVAALGLVLSALVLVQQVHDLVTREDFRPDTAGIQEFMLSPLLVLLVFLLLWLERIVGRILDYRGRSATGLAAVQHKPLLIRLRQWLGVFLAWVTTGTAALLAFADVGQDAALLLGCLVLFGGAMWFVEYPTVRRK